METFIFCWNTYIKYVCASHHMQLNSHKATQPDDCQINLNSPWCFVLKQQQQQTAAKLPTVLYFIFIWFFVADFLFIWNELVEPTNGTYHSNVHIYIYIFLGSFFSNFPPHCSHINSTVRIVSYLNICVVVFFSCGLLYFSIWNALLSHPCCEKKKLALIFSTVVSQTTLFSHEFFLSVACCPLFMGFIAKRK